MAKTQFIDNKKLKHFEKQLASRDTYVKENGDYIETKRDEIGLSSPEIISELCFALYMEDEIDDDGYNWNVNYMYGKVYYDFFNPSKDRKGILDALEILADLAEHPEIIKRLKINIDDLADYVRELWSKTTDDDFLNYQSNRPRKKSSALHISRSAGELFRQIESDSNYKNGEKVGKLTQYDENGNLRYEVNYNNGKRDGQLTNYYENGKIYSVENYKDGLEDGKWTFYNEDGSIKRLEEYKDGELDNN